MADAAEVVENSVRESFGRYLDPLEYQRADRIDTGPDLAVLQEGSHAAVGWTLTGIQVADWPGVGPASGREVTVNGATFVSGVDDAEPRQYSVIDWAAVMAQVGTLAFDRPVEMDGASTT